MSSPEESSADSGAEVYAKPLSTAERAAAPTPLEIIAMRRSQLLPALALLLAPALAAGAEPKPVPVGAKIDNLRFKDTRYLVRSLDDFPKAKGFVLVFTDTSCPLVPRYFPTLAKLEKEYRGKGVQFLAVNASADDTVVEIAAQAVEHGVEFPFVKDVDGKCVAALGAERTPEVAVLDAERRLRYRGRIDDQYRPGGSRPAPTRHDLKEALDAVLAGKEVAVPTTAVDGCRITRKEFRHDGPAVTFATDVAPLLFKHCAGCHRPDGPAPFSLLTYEDARKRGRAVAEAVADGQMPPWYAAPRHGTFTNRRGLSPAERDTIARWVQTGMARGDAAKLPKAPADGPKRGGWQIGEPDLVLSTDVQELPAEGDVPYRYVVLPYVFLAETWVQGVQILPDNPKVVHHCNMAYVAVGEKFDTSHFVTGLVPGADAMRLKDGIAYRLPRASMLALQIHFVTTGKPEKCRIRVGIKYASGTVRKRLRHVLLDGGRFSIPPQAPAHPIRATHVLDCDAVGVGLFSHMHLRGKAMTFRAQPPGKEAQTLLVIPNFSFDWQTPYVWEFGKVKFPKGTKLECVGLYDNSAFNPFNPAPNETVRSGPMTYHEMLNGFVFYVDAGEDLNLDIDPKTGRPKAAPVKE